MCTPPGSDSQLIAAPAELLQSQTSALLTVTFNVALGFSSQLSGESVQLACKQQKPSPSCHYSPFFLSTSDPGFSLGFTSTSAFFFSIKMTKKPSTNTIDFLTIQSVSVAVMVSCKENTMSFAPALFLPSCTLRSSAQRWGAVGCVCVCVQLLYASQVLGMQDENLLCCG